MHHRVIAGVVMLLILSTLPAQAQRTVVHCGMLIDPGVSTTPMAQRTLIVEGQRVVAVDAGYSTPRNDDQVVDLRESYCMPGLIDMHVHLAGESRKDGYIDRFRLSPPVQVLKASQYTRTTLLAGFTTVRDVGASEGLNLALKQAVASGWITGPRMFVAGKSLSISGGHGDGTSGYREDVVGVPGEAQGIVDGVPSAIRATRIVIKRGADLIKITATGGVLSLQGDGTGPHFKEEEIRAIVETARDHGRKVTAHAHGDEGMQRAVRAGVASIEHGTYMSAATMQMMKERGTYLVPTITAGKSVADSAAITDYYVPVVTEKALEVGPVIQGTFARAWKAGVPIAFGTDAGVFKHGRNWKEFVYMVEAGMPPMDAIRSATYNAADLLGQLDHLGTLEPGKLADVVAVPRNPLEDVAVMGEISFVMKDGRIYKMDGSPTVVVQPSR